MTRNFSDDRISREPKEFTEVVRETVDSVRQIPQNVRQAQLVRIIKFIKKRKGKTDLTKTVEGFSDKGLPQRVKNLEERGLPQNRTGHVTAFSNAVWRIGFSWDSFVELDRAWVYFRSKPDTEQKTLEI